MPAPIDYRTQPLGSIRGEEGLQAPYNQRPTNCLVRVRNISAISPRRVVKEFVSIRRGGERSITEKDGPFRGVANANVDALRFKVASGENMNWEVETTQPIDMVLRHDGRRYLIPHTDAASGEPAPWINVEPGLWDLYMGNWERIHSTDPRERIAEMQQVNGRGLQRWVVSDGNPYGFLEFSREEIHVEEALIDSDRVRSGQMMEV